MLDGLKLEEKIRMDELQNLSSQRNEKQLPDFYFYPMQRPQTRLPILL